MLTGAARGGAQRLLAPVGSWLARKGVSPDAITILGTLGVVVTSFTLVTRGHLLIGAIVITLCALADMLDGAIARATKRSSPWGAFLDSTADRIADGAIFGALTYWLATQHRYSAVAAGLACLVLGSVVPYARAKAEGLGLRADGGFAGRTERLVIIGVGGIIASMGFDIAIDIVLWLLTALAAMTVVQRSVAVHRQVAAAARAQASQVPPAKPSSDNHDQLERA